MIDPSTLLQRRRGDKKPQKKPGPPVAVCAPGNSGGDVKNDHPMRVGVVGQNMQLLNQPMR